MEVTSWKCLLRTIVRWCWAMMLSAVSWGLLRCWNSMVSTLFSTYPQEFIALNSAFDRELKGKINLSSDRLGSCVAHHVSSLARHDRAAVFLSGRRAAGYLQWMGWMCRLGTSKNSACCLVTPSLFCINFLKNLITYVVTPPGCYIHYISLVKRGIFMSFSCFHCCLLRGEKKSI